MTKSQGRYRVLGWVKPWVPAILWLLLIFLLSSFSIPAEKMKLFRRFDKLAHFLEFGVLGLLLVRGAYRGAMRRTRTYWLCLLAALGYALADEMHQMLVPYRTADIADIGADMLGAFTFAWSYLHWKGQSLIRGKGGNSGPPPSEITGPNEIVDTETLGKIT